MQKIIFVIFGFILICFFGCAPDYNSGQNPPPDPITPIDDWTIQQSNFQDNFTDIHFASSMAGWVVGENNLILSTTTGGASWPEAPVSTFEGNFRSVFLINDNQGWITGDLNGANQDGSIYISTNGGAYPESQKTLKYPMNTVFSLDENLGWAGGDNGQILFTQDGGNLWNESVTQLDFNLSGIHFVDSNKGWICGSKGSIFRSLDGGATWQNEFEDAMFDLHSICFTDSLHGWACGTNNTILTWQETNGTMQWTSSSIANEFGSITWHDIDFITSQAGWIVGDGGAVYLTIDGGKTWDKQTTAVVSDLNAIDMIDAKTGWIAGDDGVILTYTPRN